MLNAPRHRALPRPLLAGAATIAACGLAVCGLGPALGPAAAAASTTGASTTGASTTAAVQSGNGSPVSVTITSLSPRYAQPGKKVTVSGTLTNTSSHTVSGLSVQLRSSSAPIDSRSQLQDYAGYTSGTLQDDSPVSGASADLPGTLAPHASMSWSVSLNPADVPITGTFGVYPLAAQAQDANLDSLSVSRTFLPFWPNTKAQDPSPDQIAWIWPLIDQPQLAACPGRLLSNSLASSLASGGRLSGLLDAGRTYASSAHLSWAIDPALVASAAAMTKPYHVSDSGCQGQAYPASTAATAWLQQLNSATAGQPVIATPYDDADIAALIGNAMNADLSQSFKQGRTVASQLLGRNFSPAAKGADNSLNGTVWPADGVANYPDLENLAASDGTNTVVLDSSVMPPSQTPNYTPSAQTTTPDGVGQPLNVLLSDHTITQLLGHANAPSASAGTAFSVAQQYLAETAMIAAERPHLARSIVVAPPRQWDPPAGLPSELLSETASAPWLRTASLSQLTSAKHPAGQVPRQQPGTATSNAELGRPLLAQAQQVDQQAKALKSIQDHGNLGYESSLQNAVAAVESSAWRGTAGAAGAALAQQISAYLSAQQSDVKVIGAPRVTLGGLAGSVPVSVSNDLAFAVRVSLQAVPSGRVKIREPHRTVTVPAGQQEIVKLQVSAATVGSTTLRIGLATPQGTPFGNPTSVIVQATHYGDLALIIIIAALAVLLLTVAARAFRRRPGAPRQPGPPSGTPGGPADRDASPDTDSERFPAGSGSGEAGPDQRGRPEEVAGPGSFVPDGGATGQVTAQTRDHYPPEETDDYAWAPGQAERR